MAAAQPHGDQHRDGEWEYRNCDQMAENPPHCVTRSEAFAFTVTPPRGSIADFAVVPADHASRVGSPSS